MYWTWLDPCVDPLLAHGTSAPLFESVGRFKGQRAPAVVLVDIDPTPERLEQFERLAFAGMTRAAVRLETFVKISNPLNERFLTSGVTG
jgi:UvrD-like helicase C-terminal domain